MKTEYNPNKSRKLWFAVYALTLGAALVWFDKIDSGGFVTFGVAIVTGYLVTNVWQKKVTE